MGSNIYFFIDSRVYRWGNGVTDFVSSKPLCVSVFSPENLLHVFKVIMGILLDEMVLDKELEYCLVHTRCSKI